MKKILIATALLLSLNVSNASFGTKKATVATTQTATAPNPETVAANDANVKEVTTAKTDEVKSKKLSFKEKLMMKLFKKNMAAGSKSQVTALLLALFLGSFGIHRFYLGYTWQGIVQLLTLGGLGIWALIDLIRIITGDLKPKDGEYDKTL